MTAGGVGVYPAGQIAEFHERWRRSLDLGDLTLARRLVAGLPAGVTADAEGPDGETALIVAAAEGRADFCELILQAGADPARRDNFGRTAAAVFGTDCRQTYVIRPPSRKERARFTGLLRAAGLPEDAPAPRRHTVVCGDGPGTTSPDAAAKYSVFWKTVKRVHTARGLPYARPRQTDRRRGAVWLLEGERGAVREAAEDAARLCGIRESIEVRLGA